MIKYAIIKTVFKVGFPEVSEVIGYCDCLMDAEYAIYHSAINAQYGKVAKGFHAVFSFCVM